MNRIKKLTILVLGVLLGLFGWVKLRRHDKKVDNEIKSTKLPPADIARVIVDVKHKTITTISRARGSHTVFIGQSGASIDLSKSGAVQVESRTWGTEVSPFFGIGIAGKPVIALGADAFYIRKLDLGPAVVFPPGGAVLKDTRLALVGSYNFYSNTRLSVSFDTGKRFGMLVTVRL